MENAARRAAPGAARRKGKNSEVRNGLEWFGMVWNCLGMLGRSNCRLVQIGVVGPQFTVHRSAVHSPQGRGPAWTSAWTRQPNRNRINTVDFEYLTHQVDGSR